MSNSSHKERIEVLEIGQDNLDKTIKNIATTGVNQSLNAALNAKEELSH